MLAEQVVVGALAAVAVAFGEALWASRGAPSRDTSWAVYGVAALHLQALYLPAGLAVGGAVAALLSLLRQSAALAPLRARASAWHLWLAPEPRLSAQLVSTAVGLGLIAVGAREAYAYLSIVSHRTDLAASSMAGLVLAAIGAAFLSGIALRMALRPVIARLGRAGSPGVVLAALASGSAITGGYFLARLPEVVEVYGETLGLVALSATSYALLGVAVRAVARRLRSRSVWAAFGLVVVGAMAAWAGSAMTYGDRNRARAIVERDTVGGRWLLRRYVRVTDLDRDRHSWGFGGRDCDDFDARVHPGTLDRPGDGVDLDCFGGDGAPEVAGLGDGRFGTRPRSLAARPSFLFVTIDTLRPDHLGAGGYARETSPHIDAFAETAVYFGEVIAPSSRSIRSIPAMFTGLYPSQVAYGDEYLYPGLLPENQTVAELLRDRGWDTAVTMGTDYFHRAAGFYQGFEQVVEATEFKPPRSQTADRGVAQLERLASSGRPFFQWIHLFHVHKPYLVPAMPSAFGDEQLDYYDTEIRSADEQFQRILDVLERTGRARDTVVVLASDHGEEFREHGLTGHASTLYEEQLRAVWMMRVPGIAPRRVDAAVSLIDVAPTILNLAGVPLPQPISGESAVALMTGERASDRERWLFGELLPDGMFPYDIKMVRRGELKLLWWVQEGSVQLFDLARDPREEHDLSDERPGLARELLGTLQAWTARASRREQQNEAFVRRHVSRAAPRSFTHPLGFRVPGMFTLLGCDIPRDEVEPGGTLDVTCYYQVEGTTDRDLYFRLMVEGPRGYRVPEHVHGLHYPLHGRYRTTEWRAGEIIRDPTPLRFPSTTQFPAELTLTFSIEDVTTRPARILQFERSGQPVASGRVAGFRVVGRGSARGAPPASPSPANPAAANRNAPDPNATNPRTLNPTLPVLTAPGLGTPMPSGPSPSAPSPSAASPSALRR